MAGHGAGVNVVDRYEGTPALDALRHRHADVLAFLRAHGARLPAESIKGAWYQTLKPLQTCWPSCAPTAHGCPPRASGVRGTKP